MDFHGELTTGNLHLVESVSTQGLANVLGLKKIDDIVSTPFKELKAKQQVRHYSAYAASGCLPHITPQLLKLMPLLSRPNWVSKHLKGCA